MSDGNGKTRLGEVLEKREAGKETGVDGLIAKLESILHDSVETFKGKTHENGEINQAVEPEQETIDRSREEQIAEVSSDDSNTVDNDAVAQDSENESVEQAASSDFPVDFDGKKDVLDALAVLREASENLASVDRDNKIGAFTTDAIDRVSDIISNASSAQDAIDGLYAAAREILDVEGADNYLAKLKNSDDLSWAARASISVLSDRNWAIEQVNASSTSRRFVRHNGSIEKIVKKFNAEAEKLSKTGRKKKATEPKTKEERIQEERKREGFVKVDEPGKKVLRDIGATSNQEKISEIIEKTAQAAELLAETLKQLQEAISTSQGGPSV